MILTENDFIIKVQKWKVSKPIKVNSVTIVLYWQGVMRLKKRNGTYTISGIYQCANDMGPNVGLSREGYDAIGTETLHFAFR